MATHYEVLGLQTSVSSSEVKLAFKHRALVLHPDKGGSKEAFQEALLAFEILSDSTSRSIYDASLHAGRGQKAMAKPEKSLPKAAAATQTHTRASAGRKSRQNQERKMAPNTKKCWRDEAVVRPNLRHVFAQNPSGHRAKSGSGTSAKLRVACKIEAVQELSSPTPLGSIISNARRCPLKKMNVLLSRIYNLLRRLSPQSRRRAFERSFTQEQRLALEKWANSSGIIIKGKSARTPSCSLLTLDPCSCMPVPFGEVQEDVFKQDVFRYSDSNVRYINESANASDEEDGEDICVSVMELEDRLHGDVNSNDHDNHDSCSLDSKSSEMQVGACCSTSLERESYFRGNVRGIAWKIRRSKPYYQANVCMETFYLVSREVSELDSALDALVVLTTMKQRAVRCDEASFEDRVRHIVPSVLQECGMTAEQLGLGFHVMISMRFWIFPPLHTPHQHSLDAALHAWSQLAPFRKATSAGWVRELARKNPMELSDIWQSFRNTYLDILEAHGKCRQWNSLRLDALEEAARPSRERRLERWNRVHMNMEDRVQHRNRRTFAELRPQETRALRDARTERRNQMAMEAEERRTRRLYETERRLERRENRAMVAEDARSRACRRAEFKEASLNRRIVGLLHELQPLHKRLERYRQRWKRDAVRVARMSQCPSKRKK